jgi:hypothetical protein
MIKNTETDVPHFVCRTTTVGSPVELFISESL